MRKARSGVHTLVEGFGFFFRVKEEVLEVQDSLFSVLEENDYPAESLVTVTVSGIPYHKDFVMDVAAGDAGGGDGFTVGKGDSVRRNLQRAVGPPELLHQADGEYDGEYRKDHDGIEAAAKLRGKNRQDEEHDGCRVRRGCEGP